MTKTKIGKDYWNPLSFSPISLGMHVMNIWTVTVHLNSLENQCKQIQLMIEHMKAVIENKCKQAYPITGWGYFIVDFNITLLNRTIYFIL